MLLDSPECVALRADVQHTHKNKSVKAHGVVEEKSVIIQDEYREDKYWSVAIGCQQ